MLEFIREYIVNEAAQGHFVLAYGPGGAWSRLFMDCDGFRGITVLQDRIQKLRYITFEIWDSETHREQALIHCAGDYTKLQNDLNSWTSSITEVGQFNMLAQATVRPGLKTRAKAAQGSTRRTHNRHRRLAH